MSSAGAIASGVTSGATSGSVLGPLGAIGGALIGGLGSWFSSKQSSDFAEDSYKKRYQWMVKDLKKAGLNPMLAVGASPGQVPQPNFVNIREGVSKGVQAASSARLINAQTQASVEQANNLRAQTNKTMAESEFQDMVNKEKASSPEYQSVLKAWDHDKGVPGQSALASERINAELEKVKAEGAKLRNDAELSRLNAALAKGELTLQELEIQFAPQLKEIEAKYRKAMSEAEAAKVPQAEADAAFWEQAGVLGKVAVFIKSVMGGR